jgi:eukaryotic-like serine/threonine-protein kinase
VAAKTRGAEPRPQSGKDAARERVVGDHVLGNVLFEREMLATYASVGKTIRRTALVRTSAPNVAMTDKLRERLLREAGLVQRASGEGVALVLEVAPDGSYYAAEDPRGPTVAEVLAKAADGKIELTSEAAIAITVSIVAAIATVHEAGVVHGAIEPATFFLSARRRLVLFGFDRARDAEAPSLEESEPERGAIAPDHAAPETLLGAVPSLASDVFSLGVLAYELLAGTHPFAPIDPATGKRPPDVAHRIRTERAPAIPAARGIPVDLERLVLRMLGKEPGHRPKNAIDVATELATIKLPESAEAERAKLYAKLGLVERKAPRAAPEVAEVEAPAEEHSVRQVALRLVVLFALMVLVGAAIEVLKRGTPSDEHSAGAGDAHGFVRVLAHPWAEVWIDGSAVDTTPIGRPIELPAGRHTFELKHPRAPDERRVIDVAPRATSVLDVTMRVQRPPVDAGVDASP